MKALETSAYFNENGEISIHHLPAIKNQTVKLLFLIDENKKDDAFYDIALQGLAKAYSDDEPEYTLDMLKEPNPNYGDGSR